MSHIHLNKKTDIGNIQQNLKVADIKNTSLVIEKRSEKLIIQSTVIRDKLAKIYNLNH